MKQFVQDILIPGIWGIFCGVFIEPVLVALVATLLGIFFMYIHSFLTNTDET